MARNAQKRVALVLKSSGSAVKSAVESNLDQYTFDLYDDIDSLMKSSETEDKVYDRVLVTCRSLSIPNSVREYTDEWPIFSESDPRVSDLRRFDAFLQDGRGNTEVVFICLSVHEFSGLHRYVAEIFSDPVTTVAFLTGSPTVTTFVELSSLEMAAVKAKYHSLEVSKAESHYAKLLAEKEGGSASHEPKESPDKKKGGFKFFRKKGAEEAPAEERVPQAPTESGGDWVDGSANTGGGIDDDLDDLLGDARSENSETGFLDEEANEGYRDNQVNQGWDQNQQGWDQNQQGYYDQSQQGYYDPNQQSWDPNQGYYDPNQQGWDQGQQGYQDPNQNWGQGQYVGQIEYYEDGQGGYVDVNNNPYDPHTGMIYPQAAVNDNFSYSDISDDLGSDDFSTGLFEEGTEDGSSSPAAGSDSMDSLPQYEGLSEDDVDALPQYEDLSNEDESVHGDTVEKPHNLPPAHLGEEVDNEDTILRPINVSGRAPSDPVAAPTAHAAPAPEVVPVAPSGPVNVANIAHPTDKQGNETKSPSKKAESTYEVSATPTPKSETPRMGNRILVVCGDSASHPGTEALRRANEFSNIGNVLLVDLGVGVLTNFEDTAGFLRDDHRVSSGNPYVSGGVHILAGPLRPDNGTDAIGWLINSNNYAGYMRLIVCCTYQDLVMIEPLLRNAGVLFTLEGSKPGLERFMMSMFSRDILPDSTAEIIDRKIEGDVKCYPVNKDRTFDSHISTIKDLFIPDRVDWLSLISSSK